ncbi:ribulokinase [Phycisphaerales bacterium AB-hyl4]|uniref:Ribulokinase n=1 Tax=Natronomicrosphaera hydrolytica TaxID=3242702 RepID=A0ABV4U221_9BACT
MPRSRSRSTKLPLALGLDFGTESVRALLVTLDGVEHGSAAERYKHGQITDKLPGTRTKLPPDFAFQHPQDWLDASGRAVKRALKQARADGEQVIGVGVDFTSCTMLPTLRDGTPLCTFQSFRKHMFAWPKLWKHHGAKSQTLRFNELARQRKEPWLDRYGGIIGLEWFFPKVLETLEEAPAVYDAADVWLEAGDWYVWQLVGSEAKDLPRSTCQAGYKAMWNSDTGYPSPGFFKALHPKLEHVVRDKMPGRLLAPGEKAGELTPRMARKLGLKAGTPVSAAVIDAHAGVPGAGVSEAGTFVMVMGTSSCHMLNNKEERLVPGVAGVVEGGILPGYFGYETGQAAVGDAFDWLRRTVGEKSFKALDRKARDLPPGAEGVLCLDWMNGCRTPLMDGSLKGAFLGLTLNHGPEHMYRALLEASAFGVRWIIDLLEEGGVPVRKLVATGGLPHHNPLLVQIYADVMGRQITVHPSTQGPALGAAILGVLAAGKSASGFASPGAAIKAMAEADPKRKDRKPIIVKPDRKATRIYTEQYIRYRQWADTLAAAPG